MIVVFGDEHFALPCIGVLHAMKPTPKIHCHIIYQFNINLWISIIFKVEHQLLNWPFWVADLLNPCYPSWGLVTSSSRTHHSRSRAKAALDDATHSARGKETDICSAQNPSQCRWGAWKEPWYLYIFVDGSEILRLPFEVGSLSHYLQGFSTIPGGAGVLPSTVSGDYQGISKWKLWFNCWWSL